MFVKKRIPNLPLFLQTASINNIANNYYINQEKYKVTKIVMVAIEYSNSPRPVQRGKIGKKNNNVYEIISSDNERAEHLNRYENNDYIN